MIDFGTVTLANYADDLDGVRARVSVRKGGEVTDKRGNPVSWSMPYWEIDATSAEVGTLTVTDGTNSVVLYLKKSNLYIVGFRAASGTSYVLKGDLVPGIDATALGYKGDYQALGFQKTSARKMGLVTLVAAIAALSGFAPGNGDMSEAKEHLAALVIFISEGIRLKEVHNKCFLMTFGDYEIPFGSLITVAQGWSDSSKTTDGQRGVHVRHVSTRV